MARVGYKSGIALHLDDILLAITRAVERGDVDTEYALTGALVTRVGPKLEPEERDELLSELELARSASEKPNLKVRRRDADRMRRDILHTGAQRVQDRLLRILSDRKIYSWKDEPFQPAGSFGRTRDDTIEVEIEEQ